MKLRIFILGLLVGSLLLAPLAHAQPTSVVRLAYIQNNVVTLADYQGVPLAYPGPQLDQWQSASLFWSPDGDSLYIATRQGLYVTGAEGGASVRLPGDFGLTMTIARHGGVLYNLDVDSPQEVGVGLLGFPLRETNVANMEGGKGRAVSTIGEYPVGSANAALSQAAAVYARDGGLLEGGRPKIFTTYGGAIFYSCCFPNPGMGITIVGSVEAPYIYDPTIVLGGASLNATQSRLVGPTSDGLIRIYDLVSEGWRDFTLETPTGIIERTAWSLDETSIYFVSREAPDTPLELRPEVQYPADTRSSNLTLWELNLVNGSQTYVASFGDGFGVSSMAATNEYVFVVVVESNQRLVDDLNKGALPFDIALDDPALDSYIPRTTLWRVDRLTGEPFAVDEGIWGVVARPY